MLLIDISPTAIVSGAAFFVLFAVIAFVIFRLLKRTVKMALRLAIIAALLAVAVMGGIAFWWFGSADRLPQRPANSRSR